MSVRLGLLALIMTTSLICAPQAFAQDAGVSGIPRGPGNAGGLNNSLNDPSGVGNAAKVAPRRPRPLSTHRRIRPVFRQRAAGRLHFLQARRAPAPE